jgi:hypothetical protein
MIDEVLNFELSSSKMFFPPIEVNESRNVGRYFVSFSKIDFKESKNKLITLWI